MRGSGTVIAAPVILVIVPIGIVVDEMLKCPTPRRLPGKK